MLRALGISSSLRGVGRVGRRWVGPAVAVLVLAAAVNPVLAWRIQGGLSQSLATPDVRVQLVGWPTALAGRQVARVSVVAHRAMADGLVVDEFVAELRGVSLDPLRVVLRGQFAVRAVEGGWATVHLLQEDVQRALAQRPYIAGATVQFASGKVQIAGMITAVGVPVRAELTGRLVVEEARRIALRVDRMQIRGLSLPPAVANLVITPLNPLLSVDALPIPLRLTGVEINNGMVVITAEPR